MEFSMPYFIQVLSELTKKVEVVQKKTDEREKKDEKAAQQTLPTIGLNDDLGFMINPSGMGMLMPPPGSMPGMPGYGQQGGYGGMPMQGMMNPGMNPFGTNNGMPMQGMNNMGGGYPGGPY